MIKAVLFDYGGVLSPGGKSLAPIFGKLLGISAEEVVFDDLHKKFRSGDISAEDFFIQLGARYGKKVTAAEFIKYSDIFAKNEKVYAVARQLREHNIKTGILSNVYQLSADILRQDGYYDGFSPVVLSCEEGLAKPDLEFYRRAIERVGVKPSEIVFVDDQDKCLPPARQLDLHVIKAESENQIVKDLKELLKEQNGLQL